MGHHRADTRASRGRSPVTPTSDQYPETHRGKRAAGKRAARPAPRRSAAAAPAPLVERVVEQAPTPTAAGRRYRPGSPHRAAEGAVPRPSVRPDPAGRGRAGRLGRRCRHGGRPAARGRLRHQAPGQGDAGQRPQWHRRRGHHHEARHARPGRQPRLTSRLAVRRRRRRRVRRRRGPGQGARRGPRRVRRQGGEAGRQDQAQPLAPPRDRLPPDRHASASTACGRAITPASTSRPPAAPRSTRSPTA